MNVPKLRFKEFSDEWKKAKLSSFVNINPKNNSLPDKFIYIDLESVNNGLLTSKKIVNKSEAPSRAQRTIIKNDILYQTVRPYQMNNLFINSLDSDYPYIASTGYALLRTKENPYFVYSILYQKSFVNKVLDMCTGTSYPAISANDLGTISICLPSIKEQEKIGKTLSLLDKKIELQTKKIEDLKLFTKKLETQYIFNSNNEYNQKRIDEIFNIKAGGDLNKSNISFIKTPLFCYPIYSNNLEMNGLYGYSDIYKIEEESITVTGRGDIGKAIKREGKYYPIVRLLVLIPKISVNLIYMQEAINNLKLIQESTGVPQLTAPQISKYKVSYPTLDIQNKYGDILLLLQEKIRYEIRKTEKLQQLKKGLLQNMFI